jgi:hypothetical protein
MPVIKGTEHLRLTKESILLSFCDIFASIDTSDSEIASLHSKIALLPYCGTETRLHRTDVKLRVKST